jgi:endonuclease/exonuclease/phosphatase family metal-dependent hydrolase
MLVLTWNLFHGRALPPAGRPLLREFAAQLASWQWDVALLQEVPPWWPPVLGRACAASARTAPTSRNGLLPLRRAIAERAPDVIRSGGGGANAILARGGRIGEHRVEVLRWWPERRVVHGVRLDDGTWVSNFHGQAHSEERAQADMARAAAATVRWAAGSPAVLGGDTNTRLPGAAGFAVAGGHSVDHVMVRGLTCSAPARTLPRRRLSDHAPVILELAAPSTFKESST